MADFVIDANVTLAWLFAEDEHRIWMPKDWAEADMVSSWLWRLEVTNAVLVKERRRQITQAQGSRFLQVLESLEIDVVGDRAGRSMEQLALVARPHQLSAYDTVYLDLATTLGLPLCTLYHNLQAAAKRSGVDLVIDPTRSKS